MPIKSVAYQQLGVLASEQKKYPEALATFKESLKANPANEESRYNYELVKKTAGTATRARARATGKSIARR